ncbi:MAG: hypothetical protein ACT4OF_06905 [Caulobacteraceae bacterium]
MFALYGDLQGIFASLSPIEGAGLMALTAFCDALWLALTVAAALARDVRALALLLGPQTIFLALWSQNASAELTQLAGIAYPAALCAGTLLLDGERRAGLLATVRHWTGGALAAGLIAAHIPKAVGTVDYYAFNPEKDLLKYAASHFDLLEQAIGAETVRIEVGASPWIALTFLAEFGRR